MALETLAEYSTEEVLSFVPLSRKIVKVNGEEISVKTSSLRLQVFKRSLTCTSCGLIGSVFRLQKQVDKNERPHFNLYAVRKIDGVDESVLMTQDHIYPRSKGGRDHISNLSTMCVECNALKGNQIL